MLHVLCFGCVLGAAMLVGACSDDVGADDTGGTGDTGAETGTGNTGVGEQGVLGCPAGERCTFVLVSQTLDDRIEIFSPGDPRGMNYRGTLDVDLKPNIDGDNSGELLDEPFGLAIAGGHLHVLLGHFPQRDSGSLFSFPFSFFENQEVSGTIAVASYFTNGQAVEPVVEVPLEQEEPIFMIEHGSRLLVSVFGNDLFSEESNWTNPGKLLVVDAANPTDLGIQDLSALEGGPCDGAAQIVDLGSGAVAVACDGNDAVAFLDVSTVGTGNPGTAAATITGRVCPLTVAMSRRVRYLAPDGDRGVVVVVGPGGLNPLGSADLHRIGPDCALRGITPVASDGRSQPAEISAVSTDTWLLASGAGQLDMGGMRGVFVVRDTGGSLEVCADAIGGFEEHWQTPGQALDPFALASSADGTHLAVGAAPVSSASADGIYGKVLWASLPGFDDPCAVTADVVDLTAGDLVPAPDEFRTWRRAPNRIVIAEVQG